MSLILQVAVRLLPAEMATCTLSVLKHEPAQAGCPLCVIASHAMQSAGVLAVPPTCANAQSVELAADIVVCTPWARMGRPDYMLSVLIEVLTSTSSITMP